MSGEAVIVLGVILFAVGSFAMCGGMMFAPLGSRREVVLAIGGFVLACVAAAVVIIGAVIAG